MTFHDCGNWPDSPWKSAEERAQAPYPAKDMGLEWPDPSNLDLLFLPDEENTHRIYSLENHLFERVQVYMLLGVF